MIPVKKIVQQACMYATMLIGCSSAHSQAADSAKAYREFIRICTQYQRAPLQLQLQYQLSSNLVLQPGDTMTMQGQFLLNRQGDYYLRMKDIEQLITDSLSMMVNHAVQQVVVDKQAANAKRMLSRYLGVVVNDSSMRSLATAFHISEESDNSFLLQSRALLPATNIPRQTIRLRYDHPKKVPVQITTVRYSLLPVNPEDSAAFIKKFEGQGVLVSVPQAGLCFVRSHTATYTYQQLLHEEPPVWPLQVSDYATRKEDGKYELKAGKEKYRLRE